MSTPETVAEQGSVKFAENPGLWLERKEKALQGDAEPAAQPDDAEPPVETPEVAPPAPEEAKPASWRDVVVDDIDDEFFKGKPAGELDKSRRAAVAAMQRAQREANEARRELEAIRQQQAQAPAIQPSAPAQLPNPEGDPQVDEINRLLFEDTPAAVSMLERRAEERARTVFQEEYSKRSAAESWGALKRDSQSAAITAGQHLAEQYGWSDEDTAQRMQAIFGALKPYESEHGEAIWTNTGNYLGMAARLFGQPRAEAPPQVAPPRDEQGRFAAQPEISNPPGSRKPAPPVKPTARASSPLSSEDVESRRALAVAIAERGGKIDSERFIARGSKG